MNQKYLYSTNAPVPEIVHIVLVEAEKMRRAGRISQDEFERQMQRLECEELEPRRLSLLVRQLPDGRTRFLIKKADSGRVCDMVECAPRVALAA